jgi:hypothetical protein
VRHQQRDVLAPVAQGRDARARAAQQLVQLGLEGARVDLGAQVALAGRDDPHVDRHRLDRADAADLAALEHAHQLGLQLRPELADLVEKQRAAVGRAEGPVALLVGAGEGVRRVAEQLALDRAGRDRAAVDHHERPRRAPAVAVDRHGQSALAGAALAVEKDRGLTGRGPLQHAEQPPHRAAPAKHVAEALAVAERRRETLLERLEAERGVSDLELRAGVDVGHLDPVAGQQGAAARAQIAQLEAVGGDGDGQVMSRHARIAQHQMVGRGRAHAQLVRVGGRDLAPVRATHHLDAASLNVNLARGGGDGSAQPGGAARVRVRGIHDQLLCMRSAGSMERSRPELVRSGTSVQRAVVVRRTTDGGRCGIGESSA